MRAENALCVMLCIRPAEIGKHPESVKTVDMNEREGRLWNVWMNYMAISQWLVSVAPGVGIHQYSRSALTAPLGEADGSWSCCLQVTIRIRRYKLKPAMSSSKTWAICTGLNASLFNWLWEKALKSLWRNFCTSYKYIKIYLFINAIANFNTGYFLVYPIINY